MGRREGEDTQYGRIRARKGPTRSFWGIKGGRRTCAVGCADRPCARAEIDKLISRSRDLTGKYDYRKPARGISKLKREKRIKTD